MQRGVIKHGWVLLAGETTHDREEVVGQAVKRSRGWPESLQQEPDLNQPWKEIVLPRDEPRGGRRPFQAAREEWEKLGKYELSGEESVERERQARAAQQCGARLGDEPRDSLPALEHSSTPEAQASHPRAGVISLRRPCEDK